MTARCCRPSSFCRASSKRRMSGNATIRRMGLDPRGRSASTCRGTVRETPGGRAAQPRGGNLDRGGGRAHPRTGRAESAAVSVGHSTGAMMSIPLVRRHPDLFHSMALVGGLASGRRARGFDPFGAVIRPGRSEAPVFRAAFRLWLSSPFFFRRGFLVAAARSPPKGSFPELPLMRAQLAACDLPGASGHGDMGSRERRLGRPRPYRPRPPPRRPAPAPPAVPRPRPPRPPPCRSSR